MLLYLALEFVPALKEATSSQREQYKINKFGDAVREVGRQLANI